MMIGRQIGEPTPEQFEQLEHQNAGVIQKQQARSKISPAMLLQNALRALGVSNGDSKLSKLKVDGIIGPGTVKATNYAFKTYLNAPNVMSLAYVRQHVVYLGTQVTAYVQEHGGVVNPPWVGSTKKSVMLPPIPTTPSEPASASSLPFDSKYIFYGVAGISVLLALSVVASVMRGRKQESAKA